MEGLTSKEVAERKAKNQVNKTEERSEKTYLGILVHNVITPFNIVLFALGILLLVFEEPVSAVSATGIIIVNIIIATLQEFRAKRRLDKISLLTRPKVTVLRDNQEQEIDRSEIVLDDIVILRAGDQAAVDGEILESRSLELDESLLTGESSTVRKKAGDEIYSGSNCVVGEAYYRVTRFGKDNFASQMLSSAKKLTSKKTPLQMETNTVTKLLIVIAAIMLLITVLKALLFTHQEIVDLLEVFVLCIDVVPIALFLLITLTYMIAAARMADSGALLQNSNAVESLSHVGTVCMDKTGTITTNRLLFDSIEYLAPETEAETGIKVISTLTGSKNRTVQVLESKFGNTEATLLDEIQFSSERKYSAVHADCNGQRFTVFMGALSALSGGISDGRVEDIDTRFTSSGMRSVIVCRGPDMVLSDDQPIPELQPLAIVAIKDEVREDCRETIQVFLDNGMDLKVISGDDPRTIDSLFTIANIPGERKIVSGIELEGLSDEEFAEKAVECNIFGRMKPDQKEKVIESLKAKGKYVAMIGDGVNDVKSLKTAQVGIALESGAGAARGVADMILVKDNFAALPKALVEGRRTLSGMRDILKLYLTRNFVLALLFVAIYIIVGNIPMIPIQNTFYAFISVSVMAFFMTIFARPNENRGLILPGVLRYCVPASIMIAFAGMLMYSLTWHMTGNGTLLIDYEAIAESIGFGDTESGISIGQQLMDQLGWGDTRPEEIAARTAMVLFVSLVGLLQIFIICPRWRFLSIDGNINKSPVPFAITALVLAAVISMYVYFPWLAVELIGFVLLPGWYYGVIVALIFLTMIIEVVLLKLNVFKHLIERFEAYYMKRLEREYR